MRTLYVVGSAPCLYDDLERAQAARPFGETILVNGACTAVEYAEHMLAGHTAKANEFHAARMKAFPDRPIRVHANWARVGEAPRDLYPCVTDWWGEEMSTGSTSAGKAIRIGLAMGFDEIILCGSPLDGSGYVATEAVVKHDRSCARVGDPDVQQRRIIMMYRDKFKKLSDQEWKGRVFSMSGFTRDCLGEPA